MAPQAAQRRAAPIRKTEPTRKLQPGDLICGECGEGNLPTRKFCSRCGSSLSAAEVVKTPWWRKLIRRGPKTMAAGKRPKSASPTAKRRSLRDIYRLGRNIFAVVLLASTAIYGFYPPLRTFVNGHISALKNDITGKVNPQLSPLRPISTTADEQLAGHPAALATDLKLNTAWVALWSPDKHPILTLDFGKIVVLRTMIIHIGTADNFTAQDRPAILHLVFSNEKTDSLTLKDTSDEQKLSISNSIGVKSVQIEIRDVFPAQGSDTVAISEIELFGIG